MHKSKKDLAILVYVDNSPNMVEEFLWLYKSAIYSGVLKRADIIAVCHPDVVAFIPDVEDVKIHTQLPYALLNEKWRDYGFINSIGNLGADSIKESLRSYEWVLKTDCDTFVTSALVNFNPTGLCFGFGAYANEISVRQKIAECSQRWGINDSGIHNVGASVLGPNELVFNFISVQLDFCERLLAEEFHSEPGVWPGWCKNVLTMYAGELALRSTYSQRCSLGLLDNYCWPGRTLSSDVLHIHAWPTNQYWSKHDFRAGKYSDMTIDCIDRTTLAGYCHWLAVASVENVIADSQS